MKKASCTFLKFTYSKVAADGKLMDANDVGFDTLKLALDSFLKEEGYDPEKHGQLFYTDNNGETAMLVGFEKDGAEVKAAFFCTQFRVVDITPKEIEKAIEG